MSSVTATLHWNASTRTETERHATIQLTHIATRMIYTRGYIREGRTVVAARPTIGQHVTCQWALTAAARDGYTHKNSSDNTQPESTAHIKSRINALSALIMKVIVSRSCAVFVLFASHAVPIGQQRSIKLIIRTLLAYEERGRSALFGHHNSHTCNVNASRAQSPLADELSLPFTRKSKGFHI